MGMYLFHTKEDQEDQDKSKTRTVQSAQILISYWLSPAQHGMQRSVSLQWSITLHWSCLHFISPPQIEINKTNKSWVDDYFTSGSFFVCVFPDFTTQILLSVPWQIDEKTVCLGRTADIVCRSRDFFKIQPRPHADKLNHCGSPLLRLDHMAARGTANTSVTGRSAATVIWASILKRKCHLRRFYYGDVIYMTCIWHDSLSTQLITLQLDLLLVHGPSLATLPRCRLDFLNSEKRATFIYKALLKKPPPPQICWFIGYKIIPSLSSCS